MYYMKLNFTYMNFFLYIIYSQKTDHYYIGSTKNLQDRLQRHQQGRSKATKSGAPDWTVVYTETFETNSLARQRESYLKRMKSRKFIEQLITNQSD